MQKKLTITIDERVYAGLHTVVGRRRINRFIESLVRPHVIGKDLRSLIGRWPMRKRAKRRRSSGPKPRWET
jgi:hypothetical protein